ncbi:MAG: adenylate kinase [Elusimicrobiota bacterium]
MSMRLVLIGCPGAGKGTQAKRLCEKYGISHISTGDIFRSEMGKKTRLGERAENYVNKGLLVPDEFVVATVAKHLDATKSGWLLDGFPRTLDQAQALDKYLSSNKQKLDSVIYLAMNPEAVVRRLTSRRTCNKCGEVYNLETRKPKEIGKCDKCGGEVALRDDDTEKTVRKRLMVYEHQTLPLIAYYRAEHAFSEIDGAQSPDEVAQALIGAVESLTTAGSGS